MPRPLIQPENVGKRGVNIRQKYFLDEPSKRLLVERYDGQTKTIDELEKRLAVPRWKIHQWAKQLKLTQSYDPRWTKQDEIYLEANLHRMNIKLIAKKLQRTERAVREKAVKLDISKCSEGYTLCGLAQALGCDPRAIKRWVEKGWLRGAKRHTDREEGDFWYFSDKEVRKFIVAHPEQVDPRKANWLWLVDVLAGGIGELGRE